MRPRNDPREQALEILCTVEDGAFADALLDRARTLLDARDSAFLLELVYGVLRNRSRLDWTLNLFSSQPVAKTDIRTRNLLRLGAYQMLLLDRVPVSAAVNTAAELAKRHGKKSGYVNGLLRNLDRGRAKIAEPDDADPAKRLSLRYSHPLWLVKRWIGRYGPGRTEQLLQENNRPAPLVLRANTLRTTPDRLKTQLETDGAAAAGTNYAPAGLRLLFSPALRSLAAYEQGSFMVQDEAAQLISLMLSPHPGDAVLDACAAPGGKATHLAELMQNSGSIVALESDAGRIGKIRENSERLGISIIEPVLADATRYGKGAYDRILIDAPCSGLGVLRRHPDGRWNKGETVVRERALVQKRILGNCAGLLKPGGVLVYATCTTEPEENEDVVEDFLAGHSGFIREDPRPFLPGQAAALVDSRGFFRTCPGEPAMDGFFGARLKKNVDSSFDSE